MKKFLSVASAVVFISVAGVSAASAQSFATPGKYDLTGNLNLYQTIPGVVCAVKFELEVFSGGGAQINSGTFGPGLHPACGAPVIPVNFPWSVTALNAATNEFEFNVDVFAVNGQCQGTLSVTGPEPFISVVANPGEITIPVGATAPGYLFSTGASAPCTVDGKLKVTPTTATGPLDIV